MLTFSPGRSNVTTPRPSSQTSRVKALIAASPDGRDGPSRRLQDDRAALPAADAHRGEAELRAPAAHLAGERQNEPVRRGADRVAERDRAAVDVRLLPVDFADRPVRPVLRVPGGGGKHAGV